jgi:hypothetical protein
MASSHFSATDVRVVVPKDSDTESDDESSCGPLQKELRVDDPALRAAIVPFVGVPHAKWKTADVMLAVPVLRNRLCFLACGCEGKCVSQWADFVDEWEAYLAKHPKIMKLVDPNYVSFSFDAAGSPAGFAADIAATPVNLGVVAVVMAGGAPSLSMFHVGSARWAAYFAGRMRALYPAVECTSFATAALTIWH